MRDRVTLGVVAKHNILVSHQIPHLVSTLLAGDVSAVKISPYLSLYNCYIHSVPACPTTRDLCGV